MDKIFLLICFILPDQLLYSHKMTTMQVSRSSVRRFKNLNLLKVTSTTSSSSRSSPCRSLSSHSSTSSNLLNSTSSASTSQLRSFHLSSLSQKKKSSRKQPQAIDDPTSIQDDYESQSGLLQDDDLFGPTSTEQSTTDQQSEIDSQIRSESKDGIPKIPFNQRVERLSQLLSWEALDTGSRPSPRHLRHVLQAARDRDQFDQVLDLFALFRARRGNSLDSQTSDALIRRLCDASLPELAQAAITNRHVSGVDYDSSSIRIIVNSLCEKLKSTDQSVLLSSTVMPGSVKEKELESESSSEETETSTKEGEETSESESAKDTSLPSQEIITAKFSIFNRILLLIQLSKTHIISTDSNLGLTKGSNDPILLLSTLSSLIQSFNLSQNGLIIDENSEPSIKNIYERSDLILKELGKSIQSQKILLGSKNGTSNDTSPFEFGNVNLKKKFGKDLESCLEFARFRRDGEGEKEIQRLIQFTQ